jgi:hypothetical protein
MNQRCRLNSPTPQGTIQILRREILGNGGFVLFFAFAYLGSSPSLRNEARHIHDVMHDPVDPNRSQAPLPPGQERQHCRGAQTGCRDAVHLDQQIAFTNTSCENRHLLRVWGGVESGREGSIKRERDVCVCVCVCTAQCVVSSSLSLSFSLPPSSPSLSLSPSLSFLSVSSLFLMSSSLFDLHYTSRQSRRMMRLHATN